LKAKLCLVAVLFMSFSPIAIASVLVTPVAATDPVIVGKWDRTDGADKYTIYANGVTETVLPDGIHHGTWEMDGSSGYKYIFSWDFGPSGKAPFVDYVTVAADGQSYFGANNYGDDFHCVRVGGADSTPAADSGFPVIPVAVGGGIAAIAVGGAAAYYFLIAKQGAESAAGAAGATGGSASVDEKTKEVAFLHGVTHAFKETGKAIDGMGTSQHPDNPKVGGVQKLLEKVQDQTKKPEYKFKEFMPQDKVREIIDKQVQELKMKSQTTQEVADNGESSSNADA
jgi:hypothetical protein